MSSSNSHLTSEFSDLTSLLAASTRTTSCDPSLPSYCPTLPTSLLEGHLVASPSLEDCDLECANAPTDTSSSLANPGGPVLTSAAGDSADAPAYDPSLYYSTVDNTTSDWLRNVGVDEPEHLPLYSPNVAPCLFSHQIAFRVKTSLTGAVMISITDTSTSAPIFLYDDQCTESAIPRGVGRYYRLSYVQSLLRNPHTGNPLLSLRSDPCCGLRFTACSTEPHGEELFDLVPMQYTSSRGTALSVRFNPHNAGVRGPWTAHPTRRGYVIRDRESGQALAHLTRETWVPLRRQFMATVSPGVSALYVAAIALVLRLPYYYDNRVSWTAGLSECSR